MTGWTPTELEDIDGTGEVEAGDHAGDGSGLDNALDAAYRNKYGRSSGAVAHITADVALATTLRIDPA